MGGECGGDHQHGETVRLGCLCRVDRGGTILDLSEGRQLRRVRVMGANRIELSGFSEGMRERLRANGPFTEIISWKLRFFVPIDAAGPTVLGKLFDTYSVTRISDREAA